MIGRREVLKSGVLFGSALPLVAVATGEANAEAIRTESRAARSGFPPSFNPMAGNPLRTRADITRAIRNLYTPLKPYYSEGGARVRLGASGSSFDFAAADLEGFARPLWGLAPLAKGGGANFVDWALFRRGLANGTDPDHSEYWGSTADGDQRLVELSAIGFALTLIPNILWAPQPAPAKANIARYLQDAFRREFASNNWMYFRLMIGLGLEAIGEPVNRPLISRYQGRLDALYLGDGWYRDGPARRADHYVGFALQFYGLLHGSLGNDSVRMKIAEAHAKDFAPQFARWFAEDGAAVPFGRSMTYRFATAAFWSALAFANLPAIPWGQIKGLVLRHLRWWSRQPMADRDGVLSIGYGFPNLHMCEPYNSPCSPYWAFKVFAFMALPENHPFWTSPEEGLPPAPNPSTQVQPGMILFNPPGDAIALAGGQEEHAAWLRLAPEKYGKFAYSARYGFSIETDLQQFERASFDNMLGFSIDGHHFWVREGNSAVRIADNLLYASWSPHDDLDIETWLFAQSPWHVRIHQVTARRAFKTIEGGFAIARREGAIPAVIDAGPAMGLVSSPADFSGIRDLGSTVARRGHANEALANSNLVNARTIIPQLRCEINVGETVLRCAVLALGDPVSGMQEWQTPPLAPSINALRAKIAEHGKEVGTMAPHRRVA